MTRSVRFVVLLSLLSGIAVAGLSSSPIGEQRKASGGGQARENLLTFVTYRYVDPTVGMEAFRLHVPKGWQAEGQMVMRNIRAIGRIGEIAARAGSEMRADQQAAWEQRQQVNDKISQNFSDYIRGVDRFNDPISGKEVELPAGYGTAWANNLGEYIVTDSPGYNPNIGSNLTWQQMQPRQ